MKKDGREPIGPTMTTQGSFGDCRAKRERGWAYVTCREERVQCAIDDCARGSGVRARVMVPGHRMAVVKSLGTRRALDVHWKGLMGITYPN